MSFYAPFPFLPHRSPAFLGGLSGGICSVESQLHEDGASLPRRVSLGHAGLYLPGCVTASLDHLFLSWCCDELAEVENADCRKKRYSLLSLGRDGEQARITVSCNEECGKESPVPPGQGFCDP